MVRGRLEPEVGALFMRALAAARETLYQRGRADRAVTRFNEPSADRPSMAQQQADALALLAEAALDHGHPLATRHPESFRREDRSPSTG